MADILSFANMITITGGSATPVLQPLLDTPMDVSPYDLLDLQFMLQGSNNAAGVEFTMVTSMSLGKVEDASWVSMGSSGVLSTANLGTPVWAGATFPSTGQMFRYVRYRVDFQTGTTSATFSITGMGRRRVA